MRHKFSEEFLIKKITICIQYYGIRRTLLMCHKFLISIRSQKFQIFVYYKFIFFFHCPSDKIKKIF